MSEPPIHPDPTTIQNVADHPDNDPTYQSNVNWGSIKMVANSGIRIVYGGPHYGRDPINGSPRGIGIWKRSSPNFRSWDGLLEIPLHLIVTRWVLSGSTFGLRLPLMGMPPREPSPQLMHEARHGIKPFSEWFVYATVIPARLFGDFVNIDPKTATMELRGSWRDYNYSTASPENDIDREAVSETDKSLDNLYYIQLIRNELPSYHFWSYTDPVQNGGEMRHGLISKGAAACYDVDDNNLIRNAHFSFNRLQNLPLRSGDPLESEQITYADPRRSPRRSRGRSMSPRNAREANDYRTRSDEDTPPQRIRGRKRRTIVHDRSYKPKRGELQEQQEVKVNKTNKRQTKDEETYKPVKEVRDRTPPSDESED